MVHIVDLNNHCYFASGLQLRAVGWLESTEEFNTGLVSTAFLARIQEHLKDPFGIIDFAGSHTCSLCGNSSAPQGNGELIIPASEVCYVAPVLIAHYIEVHQYLPPESFIAAVLSCPPQKSPEYMLRISPFLAELNNVA